MSHSTTTPRRDRNGLSRDDRARLRNPDAYVVTRKEDGWDVRHREVPVGFTATRVPGSREGLHVFSGVSGLTYRTTSERCSCPDDERARAEGRPCKHRAVWTAIALFQVRRRMAHAAGEKVEVPTEVPGSETKPFDPPVGVPQVIGRTSDGGTITLTRNPTRGEVEFPDPFSRFDPPVSPEVARFSWIAEEVAAG